MEGVPKFMNDGTVKYPHYQGWKFGGMKNKRTKKVEAMRMRDREERREARKKQQKEDYKSKSETDGIDY